MAKEARTQRSDTRAAILDAAIAQFIDVGFETTPMDTIAAAAGVAKGTLYYHFNSKTGIVDAIVERYAAQIEQVVMGIVGDRKRSVLDRLKSVNQEIARVNGDTIARLHRMSFIDIHKRTTAALFAILPPAYAQLFEEGTEQKLWQSTHPLELAEILVVAGAYLFDPEQANARSGERLDTFIEVCARSLGVNIELLQDAFAVFREP